MFTSTVEVFDQMTNSRIAILTDHSLLVDGITSRLQEYPEALDVRIFDKNEPNVLANIETFHPLVVILEECETHEFETCFLNPLLNILPNLILIYLRHGQPKVQIIQSGQYPANRVRELVDIIQQSKVHDSIDIQNSVMGLSINKLVEIYAGDKHNHAP